MLSPDTVLQSRYRIVRKLGAGGMGTVYEAIDLRFNSQVALKETHFTEEPLRKQFEREAHLLYNLRHPAIARVIDHFTENDGQFLVMDYVEGEDLWEMLEKQGGAFPVEEVLEWADQLLNALDYLHSQNPPIIHRDIKPQNLKLTGRNQIVLLDFGLAKGFAGQISRVTTSGSVFGYTPNYAPLEQVHGTGTDARSDLYSLAASIYNLLTGKVPPDALSRAMALTNEQPDPLCRANEANPKVPVEVAEVLWLAMATNLEKRPTSAAELRELLIDASRTQQLASNELKETILRPTIVSPALPAVTQEEGKTIPPTIAKLDFVQKPVNPRQTIAAATVASQKALSTSSSEFAPSVETSQPLTFEQSKHKLSRLTWAIGSVVFLLITAFSIALILNFRSKDSTNTTQSASEAAQHGKAAETLLNEGRYAEAESKYRESIRLEPNNPQWFDGLRVALNGQDRESEAKATAQETERLARESLRAEPNNAKWHTYLGGALRYQEKYEEAEAETRRAIRLDPNFALAHQYLGLILYFQEKYGEAETEYKEAIRLDSSNSDSHSNLAAVLYLLKKDSEAEAEYREAVRYAPNNARRHHAFGLFLKAIRKYDEAKLEFREAVRLDSYNPRFRKSLEQIEKRQ